MGFAAAMMIAGTGMQALSQYRQGQYASMQAKAQARISDYNAETAEANAEAIKQKSIFDQIRALKRGRRIEGRLRAGMGAAGAVVSEGAPADVLAEQGFENALDVALIGYEGMVGAERQKNKATMYRAESANYQATAESYKDAGLLSSLGTIGSGLGNMYLLGAFGSSSGGGTSPSLGQPGVTGYHVP